VSSTTGAFLEQVITATLYRPSAQRHGYSHSGVPSDVKVAATSWPNKTRWIGSKILPRLCPLASASVCLFVKRKRSGVSDSCFKARPNRCTCTDYSTQEAAINFPGGLRLQPDRVHSDSGPCLAEAILLLQIFRYCEIIGLSAAAVLLATRVVDGQPRGLPRSVSDL